MSDLTPRTASPSRRDLLNARFAGDSVQIASLLVQAWPKKIPLLEPYFNEMNGVEVHQTDAKGQMIVSIEATSDRALLASITAIEKADGVIIVSMVYHEIDDEDNNDE